MLADLPAGLTVAVLTPSQGTSAMVSVRLKAAPHEGIRGAVRVRVEAVAETAGSAALRLTLDLPRCHEPWWLVPGAFYGETRPADCDRRYPRVCDDRLDALTSPTWEVRADRTATPAVFALGSGGAALLGPETTPIGQASYGFGPADIGCRTWVTVPYREEPVRYDGSATAQPPVVTWYEFAVGEEVAFDLVVCPLADDRHAYAPVLAARRAELLPDNPVGGWMDPAEASELAAYGLLHWHYDPDPGVLLETVAFDRGIAGSSLDRQAMHVGWVSGIPWAYAMAVRALRVADQPLLDAACRVIDFVCSAISPSGTFYGVWYRNGGWKSSWTPVERGVHARTVGEAVLFLQRLVRAVPELAERHPTWHAAVESHLAAMTARQRDNGDLGALHDHDTGEVLRWSGAAGVVWLAVLAESGDPGRLDAATRAGGYYARYVETESLHGGTEDVDLAPTSEDGYLAVIGYLALWRATDEPRWLDLACRAADWMLTFRYSYNVTFDPLTTLGVYRFRSRGADQASPSNQHLHSYGLVCTAELYELSRATGDPSYAAAAEEQLACFRQFVARVDGDFNAHRGMVTERFYQTDCFEPKGMILTLSHSWCAGAILLGNEVALGNPKVSNLVPTRCHRRFSPLQ